MLKQSSILAVALLLGNIRAAGFSKEPPTTGKFFYADYEQMDGYGLHKLLLQIENPNSRWDDYPLQVTMAETQLSLVDTNGCKTSSCNAYRKYDINNSKNWKPLGTQRTASEWINIYNILKRELISMEVKGKVDKDNFRLDFVPFKRETTLVSHAFMRINGMDYNNAADKITAMSSMYSGFAGLAPVTQYGTDKNVNFLQQLKDTGLIDNLTVSFYIDSECHWRRAKVAGGPNAQDKHCSHIKFGSYDRSSMADGQELTLLRPATSNTWDLSIDKFTVGNMAKPLGAGAYLVRFSPELPYLYLPEALYDSFTSKINTLYGKTVCSKTTNTCKFDTNCVMVPYQQTQIDLTLSDDTSKHIYGIPQTNMLLSGTHFGDDVNTCYMPIFSNGLRVGADKRAIFIGNIFMQEYLTVFDQSQFYNTIGLAPKAKKSIVGAQHYSVESALYSPEPEANDSSTVFSGVEDQYEQKKRLDEIEDNKRKAEIMRQQAEETQRLLDEAIKRQEQEALEKQQREEREKIEADRLAKEKAEREAAEAKALAEKIEKEKEEAAIRQRIAERQAEEAARKKKEADDAKAKAQAEADAAALAAKKKAEEEAEKLAKMQREADAAKKRAEELAIQEAAAKKEREEEAARQQKIIDEANAEIARIQKEKQDAEAAAKIKAAQEKAAQAAAHQKELDEQAAKAKAAQDALEKQRQEEAARQKQAEADEKARLEEQAQKDAETAQKLKDLEEEKQKAARAKEEADRKAELALAEQKRANEAADLAQAQKDAIEKNAQEELDRQGGTKNFLFIAISLTILIIAGMLVYIWKKRQNRYKFKKDEIFDEILDRGHLDSDNMPESRVINDSFNDDMAGDPGFKSKLTSQIVTNIQ